MAGGTYGSKDAQFTIPKDPNGSKYYTQVNRFTKIAYIRKVGTDDIIGSYDFNTKKYTAVPRFKDVVDPNDKTVIDFIAKQGYESTWRGIFRGDPTGKVSIPNAKDEAAKLLGINKAKPDTKPTDTKGGAKPGDTPDPASPNGEDGQSSSNAVGITSDNYNAINDALKKSLGGTKEKADFGNWVYPTFLHIENRDCIQFSIIEYKARTLSLSQDTQNLRRSFEAPLGTITLPIPSGIGDRNTVDWQSDSMSNMQTGVGGVLMSYLSGGADAAGAAAEDQIKAIGADPKILEAIIATKTTEAALGTQNVMARQFGGIMNPNMELLFNGPSLREFSFQFRMTPRSRDEAKIVRTIIRTFKQAMAARRSTSTIVLKTPLIFNIKYISNNADHPYLNKFKQCALTNCSVNYTPDGTYSVYKDSSMTCYELSLGFQELQPIYNDDYGDDYGVNNPSTTIGY